MEIDAGFILRPDWTIATAGDFAALPCGDSANDNVTKCVVAHAGVHFSSQNPLTVFRPLRLIHELAKQGFFAGGNLPKESRIQAILNLRVGDELLLWIDVYQPVGVNVPTANQLDALPAFKGNFSKGWSRAPLIKIECRRIPGPPRELIGLAFAFGCLRQVAAIGIDGEQMRAPFHELEKGDLVAGR